MARDEWYCPYIVSIGISITMNEIAQATDANVQKISAVSFASSSVERFTEINLQMFKALVPDISAKCVENVMNIKARLTFCVIRVHGAGIYPGDDRRQ